MNMPCTQAKVFELEYTDGRPTGKVLKVAHTGGQGACRPTGLFQCGGAAGLCTTSQCTYFVCGELCAICRGMPAGCQSVPHAFTRHPR